MKYLKLQTIEEYQNLNNAVSVSRGYPDTFTGTERYAPENPELTQVKNENDIVIESYYMFPLAEDIFQVVVLMAGKPLVIDDTEIIIPNSGLQQ